MRLQACLVVVVLGLAASAAAQDAGEAEKFRGFAAELLESIPADSVIAVKPFKPAELTIGAARARAFNAQLTAALFDGSAGRHRIMSLDELPELIAQKCELDPEECERAMATFLNSAGRGVMVIGVLRAREDEIALRYSAIDLSDAVVVGRTSERSFVDEVGMARAIEITAALQQASEHLAQNTEDLKVVCPGRVTFQDTLIQTPFGAYVANAVTVGVQQAAANVLTGRSVSRGIARDGICPAGEAGGAYTLTGSYWALGEQISIELSMRDNDDRFVSSWTGNIRTRTVPAALEVRPTEEGEKVGQGSAVLGADVSPDEALLRARMQARLQAVAVALHRPPPSGPVATPQDAQRVLAALSDAVTYDEDWGRERQATRREVEVLQVQLRGRVRALGGVRAPVIEARLRSDDIVAGEPLVLSVTSDARAFVGIYAWGADDRIVRLLPGSPDERIVLRPGGTLVFPPDGGLSSGPLPGSPLNTEALVVVASSEPVDFIALASPVAGLDIGETMAAAIPVNEFNVALSKLDREAVTVRYVPYTVRAP